VERRGGWVGDDSQFGCCSKQKTLCCYRKSASECVCSDSRLGVHEVFVVLGWHAALIGSWLLTFRGSLSIPSSKVKQLVVGYRRFGTTNLSPLQKFTIWWLATDVSGHPIYPIFKGQAVGVCLPTFRDSHPIPSSKGRHLVVGYRRFGTSNLSHLQKSSSWWLLPTFRDSQPIPSSKVQHLVVGYRRFGTSNLSHLQKSSSWWLVTDVSGQPTYPLFKNTAFGGWLPTFLGSSFHPIFKGRALEHGTDRLYLNVDSQLPINAS